MTCTAVLATPTVTGSALSLTTGWFSAAAGDLLVAVGYYSIDPQVSDTSGGMWAGPGPDSALGIWTRTVTSDVPSMTVSLTAGGVYALTVWRVTGWAAIGAVGPFVGNLDGNHQAPAVLTSTAGDGLLIVGARFSVAAGPPTSADLTIDAWNNPGIGRSGLSGHRAISSIGAQSADLDASGDGAGNWRWAAAEIISAGISVTGTGGLAMPPLAVSGVGGVDPAPVTGTGGLTLAAFALTASAALTVTGVGGVALPPLAEAATAAQEVTGAGGLALSPLATAGTGSFATAGQADARLSAYRLSGAGTVIGGTAWRDIAVRASVTPSTWAAALRTD